MISVPSACHTATALSITAPGPGIASPFTLCAVNTTCHIPTIDTGSLSSSFSANPAFIRRAPPICSCQLDGLTSFVDKPHCARAPGAVAKASTSATNIDANLQFLDMSFFLLGRGEQLSRQKRLLKNRSRRIPERIRRLRVRSKDMLCVEKCRCRLTPKLTAICAAKAMNRW